MSVTLSGVHIPIPLLVLLFLHALIKIPQKQFTVDFLNRDNSSICTRISLMPTTRKQKKARKSRGLKLLSDIGNLGIMLGERHSERDESANSNSARRPKSATSDMFEDNEKKLVLESYRNEIR